MLRRLLAAAVLVIGVVVPAAAQNFAPQPPPQKPRFAAPQANICSTDWGWCPIQTVALAGGQCYCFVPPSTWLPGLARNFPYEGPVSPYLNPHTGPPPLLR
jgi:hypothetical protein